MVPLDPRRAAGKGAERVDRLSWGGSVEGFSPRRKRRSLARFRRSLLRCYPPSLGGQTLPVEVPHPPMPEGGGSRRLHCELRRVAPTDKVQRKKVQVVLKLLERKRGVVCLQPWIVFVEDGNDAVARRLLNREEVPP